MHVFFLTRVSNFHGLSIEITKNHVFATLVTKIGGCFFRNSGKLKSHVIALTRVSNFHGFSMKSPKTTVLPRWLKKIGFSRFVEKTTLVAALVVTPVDGTCKVVKSHKWDWIGLFI